CDPGWPVLEDIEVTHDDRQLPGKVLLSHHQAGKGNDLGWQVDCECHVIGKARHERIQIPGGPCRIASLEQYRLVRSHDHHLPRSWETRPSVRAFLLPWPPGFPWPAAAALALGLVRLVERFDRFVWHYFSRSQFLLRLGPPFYLICTYTTPDRPA